MFLLHVYVCRHTTLKVAVLFSFYRTPAQEPQENNICHDSTHYCVEFACVCGNFLTLKINGII
jgi:hypothetical protein